MKFRRVRAKARKEVFPIVREQRSLPGYALALDVNAIPTVIVDQARTPASRNEAVCCHRIAMDSPSNLGQQRNVGSMEKGSITAIKREAGAAL